MWVGVFKTERDERANANKCQRFALSEHRASSVILGNIRQKIGVWGNDSDRQRCDLG
jgi:hypothetical protein